MQSEFHIGASFIVQISINESQKAKEMHIRRSINKQLRASCNMFRLINVIFRDSNYGIPIASALKFT